RLPKEPLVFNTAVMPDGVGQYGGVFRHVIGGRPEGWNWAASQVMGWGGVDYSVMECLTRTGPMYQLTDKRLEPLPNLAKSWEWSEDGRQLTMQLVEGARWSDGDPFDAEDVMFYWEDNVLDPNVPARADEATYGKGTTLEKIDDYTIRWTFPDVKPHLNLYYMAFIFFCPGPSHILKPHHPKYADGKTYQDYVRALAPDKLPWVVMGAWVPVEYKPDQIIVMRRNPYYWKVDDQGNQLPYIDEMHFKLSTWEDRTIQTLAGTADYANMENPPIYVEALKRLQDPNAPARIAFGPRTLGWNLQFNLSKDFGARDERDKEIRKLNRTFEFRRAVSQALDREAIGQSLVRGPFTHPNPGGLYPETTWFDPQSSVFYPYAPETSKALLAQLGFKDTDGNGIVNWSTGPLSGRDLEISMAYGTGSSETPNMADSIVAMLREVGIKVISRPVPDVRPLQESGDFDAVIDRGEREYGVPVQDFVRLAPISPTQPWWHRTTADKPRELLPFENDLVKLLEQFRTETDSQKAVELIHEFNKVFTENIYHVGLITAPGALIVHKRIRNAGNPPILLYDWAEDAAIRERFWVPRELQDKSLELFPERLPTYK
nr:ABC transporter substrate-binding protein [Pseudomonadota bacterium]